MTDTFGGHNPSLESPISNAFTITPATVAPLDWVTRAIWVGTGGNINVRFADDEIDTILTNVPDGSLLPFRLSHVRSASTTASNLVGMY